MFHSCCFTVGVWLLVFRCWCFTVGVSLLAFHCWCFAVGVSVSVSLLCFAEEETEMGEKEREEGGREGSFKVLLSVFFFFFTWGLEMQLHSHNAFLIYKQVHAY